MLLVFVSLYFIKSETLTFDYDYSSLYKLYQTFIIDCIFGNKDIENELITKYKLKSCAKNYLYKLIDDENFERISQNNFDKRFITYHIREIAKCIYKNLFININKLWFVDDIKIPKKLTIVKKFILVRIKFTNDLLNTFKLNKTDDLYINKIRYYRRAYKSENNLDHYTALINNNVSRIYENQALLKNNKNETVYENVTNHINKDEIKFESNYVYLIYFVIFFVCLLILYKYCKKIKKINWNFCRKDKIVKNEIEDQKTSEEDIIIDNDNISNIIETNEEVVNIENNNIYGKIWPSSSTFSINKQTTDVDEMIKTCKLICRDFKL